MTKRSTLLIVVGVAVFLLGAGLVVVSLGGNRPRAPATGQVAAVGGTRATLVVTTAAVSAGTSGESLIESKSVALQSVPAAQAKPTDVTTLTALEQQSLVHSLPAGTAIQSSDLSPAAGPVAAPAGDQSVAVTLGSSAAGLAGYLQPGSYVDIYANVVKGGAIAHLPCVVSVAHKVLVLDVSDEVPAYRSNPTSGGRSAPGSITVLLAVTPAQAPTIVYYTSNEQLYLLATNQSGAPVSGACSGMVAGGALAPVS